MPTKRIRHLGAVGLGAAVLLAAAYWAASAPATGSRLAAESAEASSMIVSDWNAIAQAETVLLRPTAHGQTRGIAMVEGAVYDAVNAIDRGYHSYLLDLHEIDADPSGSQGAAAATAAYRVLRAITPPARHAGLDASYMATLATIPDGPAEQEGVGAGEAAAAA
ncbi:MAG: hypothetical protein H0U82_02555, partial [Actinobacteria bacterium]|nr:hypothetical protein [Actinomycetota bacterium]